MDIPDPPRGDPLVHPSTSEPRMRVLVVNAGSSTLKVSLLDAADSVLAHHELAAPAAVVDPGELAGVLSALPEPPDAVGHRVVHGGDRFLAAVRLDDEVLGALRDLTALAPLHQPKSIAAIAAAGRALPDVPAAACFDTAFHARMPRAASTYALPRDWIARHRLRRFGFHGLSHAYASRRAADLLGRAGDGDLRLVTCHLGAGASLAAVHGGRSVDTTMGFTPLEGLAMATRSGSVDPGLVLWLMQRGVADADELADVLEHRSGMVGLAGTSDMREVVERDDDDAQLAFDVYVHRLRGAIGAMTAALGGLDALVFTGGVGERSSAVRAAAAGGLEHLGVAVDERLNADAALDADVSATGASAHVLVVRAREDLEIAAQTRAALAP